MKQWILAWISSLPAVAVAGCELVVHFDLDRIGQDGGSAVDAAASADAAGVEVGPVIDAAPDGDQPGDSGLASDAAVDGSQPVDSGPAIDAAVDSGPTVDAGSVLDAGMAAAAASSSPRTDWRYGRQYRGSRALAKHTGQQHH